MKRLTFARPASNTPLKRALSENNPGVNDSGNPESALINTAASARCMTGKGEWKPFPTVSNGFSACGAPPRSIILAHVSAFLLARLAAQEKFC